MKKTNTKNVKIFHISEGSVNSKNKYAIEIDFDTEEINGFFVGNGMFYQISLEESIEILESMIQFSRTLDVNITSILDKAKKEI